MKQKLNIIGMSCSVCVSHVEKAINRCDGIIECNVSLLTNSATIKYDEKKTSIEEIIDSIKKEGYDANIYVDIKDEVKLENKKVLKRIIISFAFLIPLFLLSMGYMYKWKVLGILLDIKNCFYFGLILIVLTIPILITNRIFYIRGYKNLFKLNPNMDTLIAIGSTASFIYALVSYIIACIDIKNGNNIDAERLMNNLYFDSAGMILTLVTFGKYLESLAKKKTTASIEKLVNLLPTSVVKIIDGKEETINIDEIRIDDELLIKVGDRIPVDGIVISGKATLNTSIISGESIPKFVKEEDKVISSSLCENGSLIIKATTTKSTSTFEKIVELVNEASNSKAPISRIADRVSKIFVPVVLSISILTLINWVLLTKELTLALRYSISVLVISCPCALGLATPVAIMVSVGKGANYGIVNKSAESIEAANYIDTVILDKTGTLTKGEPEVVDIKTFGINKDELISIAYSLEKTTIHPLSLAIKNYALSNNIDSVEVNNINYIIGKGVVGFINEKPYYLGSINYISEIISNSDEISKINDLIVGYANNGMTTLILTNANEILGIIAILDTIKESSIKAIEELKKMNINVIMATGDNDLTAKAIGKMVDINDVRSSVLPIDKKNIVLEFQEKSHKVAMIGDGINDSLALVTSDLGIAIANGSDIATDYADVILTKSDLLDAVNALKLAKKTMKVIKFNLGWAFMYNIIAIPIACGIFNFAGISLTPMIASICMSCSSLLVVLTALTINTFNGLKNENIDKEIKNMEKIIKVDGMMCMHCAKRVSDALKALDNVKDVNITLETKEVSINYTDELDLNKVKEAIEKAGYTFLD